MKLVFKLNEAMKHYDSELGWDFVEFISESISDILEKKENHPEHGDCIRKFYSYSWLLYCYNSDGSSDEIIEIDRNSFLYDIVANAIYTIQPND